MPIRGEGVQVGPWFDGVDYSRPAEDLDVARLAEMENCRIGPSGEVEKRLGSASYQSADALGSTPTLTMAAEYDVNATTTYVVIVAGAAIYYYNAGWTDITGGTTVTAGDDNTFEWANANGTLVACNGVDTNIWQWNGSGNTSNLDVDSRFTKAQHIAFWDNRLWVGGTNLNADRVWYSDIGAIETWGLYSYYNLGARITGLVPANAFMAIHTTDGIHVLKPNEGTTGEALPYRLEKLGDLGGVDARSIVTLPGDRQLFLTLDGIYQWDGRDRIQKVSYALEENYWPTINTARLKHSFAVYVPRLNEAWFFLPYGASQTDMNQVMIYNEYVEEGADKFRWYGPYTGWTRFCGGVVSNKVHSGGAGILWDSETGNADNGTAIQASFRTAAPSPKSGSNRQRWLFARTFFDPVGDYSLTLSQQAGGVVGTTYSLALIGTGFTLDSSQLDIDKLGTGRAVYRDTPLNGYSPHMGLQYANGAANQPFTIRRVHLHHRDLQIKRRRKPGAA